MGLMGTTGLAMGWVVHSPLLMAVAGILGLMIGGFVGWLGGRRFMVIIEGKIYRIHNFSRIEVVRENILTPASISFERTESLHRDLKRAGMEQEAQYATLFNHFIRWNMGMNLRELGHLVELRTQKAGHPKYRRTAQMMARLYLKRHPEMEPVLQFVDYNDYDGGITRADQEARTARKSLASNLFDDQDH